ncbi:major facilitator superfamily domain-containing protein [Coniochaeta sp. 2T2.1]|nr:major facilitator superfamily domain-containing protein [Coniochaeta sp. 2T2.1]
MWIDTCITAKVTLLYMCCAIDRADIGNAKIKGMATDLNLVGYRYNTILSIFFVVYLSVEVSCNVMLKHFGPRFYVAFLVFSFGLVSLCTAFVQLYADLAVARTVLGVFEGGVMPVTAFFLSCFYKKSELFVRMSIFLTSSSLANSCR